VIALAPLGLYPAGPLWRTGSEVLLATFAAFGIFQCASARLIHDDQGFLMRQRIRMAASASAAGLVFLAQLI
jgi:hypothetical protein